MHDGSMRWLGRTEIPGIAGAFSLEARGFATERAQSTMKSFAPAFVRDRWVSAPSATW